MTELIMGEKNAAVRPTALGRVGLSCSSEPWSSHVFVLMVREQSWLLLAPQGCLSFKFYPHFFV